MRWLACRRLKKALRELAVAEAALEAFKELADEQGMRLEFGHVPIPLWEDYRELQERYFHAVVAAAEAEAYLDDD